MTPDSGRHSRWDRLYRELRQEPYQSEAVRLTTIQILGFIAVCNGFLIAFTVPETSGGLYWFEQLWGWPVLVGSALGVAGAFQLWSVVSSHPKVAGITCYLCALWYALFASGFIVQWVLWAIDNPDYPTQPNIYPVSVYLGFAALHIAQASTIRKKHKVNDVKTRLEHRGTLSDG